MPSAVRPRAARALVAAAAAVSAASAAACGSTVPAPRIDGESVEAVPVTMLRNDEARTLQAPAVDFGPGSESRVLAYVNGEVVNYRDVRLRVGPGIQTIATDGERATEERRALLDILRERILHRAALDASIRITRDELELARQRRIRTIQKNGGGTLDAFLEQSQMTRREFDAEIERSLRMDRYVRAAIGRSADANVRVRAITDTYVTPREIRAYYDRNPEKFQVPEVTRIRVLPVRVDRMRDDKEAARAEARALADEARRRLVGGEDFVPVYRELVPAPLETDPPDGLYEIRPGGHQVAGWILEHATRNPRGTISEVVERGGVFYVLLAEGTVPAHTLEFDDVQGKIQSLLQEYRILVATYEVELSLLEEAVISPRERRDELRQALSSLRRKVVEEVGL